MNNTNAKSHIKMQEIDALIETLKSKDGIARQHARFELVKIGEPALDSLIKAFKIRMEPLHWEVAKTLSQIGTPKAAHVLVEALEDKEFSIRWIAAEGLIHTGAECLVPLMKVLKDKAESVWLREGVHHVIHDLISRKLIDEAKQEIVSPVLEAIDCNNAEMETELAAEKAFKLLGERLKVKSEK